MQSAKEIKLSGINVWFIIEILSFYGYILAAILFIFENSIWSSLGKLNKTNMADRYRSDFIVYHRREIDWFAFLLILFIVNAGLISIEQNIVFKQPGNEELHAGPLRPLMYQLLVNHTLHIIFKRNFFDEKRKINKGHKWIWWFNLASYGFIFYVYFLTDAKDRSQSDYAKCWIPLDFILMALVAIFYFSSKALEKLQESQPCCEDAMPEESIVQSVDYSNVEFNNAQIHSSSSFWRKFLAFAHRKKEQFDSIYEVEKPKVEKFALKNDAATLGFCTFLNKDILGLDLSYEQQSDVYQNTLIVHLTQLLMIFCVVQYEKQNANNLVTPSDSLDMMIARFVASIMMHINVE